ncbi:proline dehydrogenase family protein [Plebeiibacterium sediminum]|uniref:proline dehydrogenase n=1 Tax=Plebeiibacterium sediminum TaxID=2992112 RepID=A0AAE3M5W0_9BACT|nr:proline dehydrogenase family protein [Plebeiobacterium sediminum]MCW3787400.1 proline dehydrogenase family protein [Plebeiobacterium sediminum]
MINKAIASVIPHFPKKFVWIFSKKYIAGETIDEAILASKSLNEHGVKVTVDLLGEFITNISQADENRDQYLRIVDAFQNAKINGNYSIKPTSFGLLIDPEKCYQNIRTIVALAAKYNSFVRIDMEDAECVDLEMTLYKRLKLEFPHNVGLVIQAYLYRTESDVDNLLKLHTPDSPLNFRLCKGIYIESEDISIKDPKKINDNYLKILDKLLFNGVHVGIATHDKKLINGALELIKKHNVPKDMYEFQMLYGVTPELRNSIVGEGHDMRVYVPYGKDWFGYSTRRLKENPKMAQHVIKSIFVKG